MRCPLHGNLPGFPSGGNPVLNAFITQMKMNIAWISGGREKRRGRDLESRLRTGAFEVYVSVRHWVRSSIGHLEVSLTLYERNPSEVISKLL